MAIVEIQNETGKGFKKELDSNATALILENLQKFQYKYPIDSTVREVVSNAIDSVREKNIAKAILSGKSKESDFFEEIEGDLYQSSKFNKNYYDLNHLSASDEVIVNYRRGEDRDTFEIIDHGVGLGEDRLEGFFQLAYSSKRLNKATLGRYGLGAKAPLSTGCESFMVETVYNGKKFKFEVFTHKVDSLISQWHSTKDEKNKYVTFSNGFQCYYEETDETNGVKISIPVKKHNRQKYMNAVEKQLMYLPEIILFTEIFEDGYERPINFKARVEFSTDDIIISSNRYYNRPHIVLNNTVYGFIDFEELDLEIKYGSVGIKVTPENIDISPSREEVLWTAKTKEEILKKYTAVEATASEYVAKELKGLDYFEWVSKAFSITRNNGDGPLYHLGKICKLSTVTLKWDKDPSKRYSLDLSTMWGKNWEIDQVGSDYSGRPKRTQSCATASLVGRSDKLYLKDCIYSGKIVPYLQHLGASVINYTKDNVVRDFIYGKLTKEQALKEIDEMPTTQEVYKITLKSDLNLAEFFLSLKEVHRLTSLEIPEDFVTRFAENEGSDGESELIVNNSQARKDLMALRKAQGKIAVSIYFGGKSPSRGELVISELAEPQTCVYGTNEDRENLLKVSNWFSALNDVPTVYLIAKSHIKKFAHQIHVSEIFTKVDENGTLIIHPFVKKHIVRKAFAGLISNISGRGFELIRAIIPKFNDICQQFYKNTRAPQHDPFWPFLRYFSIECRKSEMSQNDVLNIMPEEFAEQIKAIKHIEVFTEEELEQLRWFYRFIECFSPAFDMMMPYGLNTTRHNQCMNLLKVYISSKFDEFGEELEMNEF